jgi:hypothetical protein
VKCKDCIHFELCANGYGEVTADTEIINVKGKQCYYFKSADVQEVKQGHIVKKPRHMNSYKTIQCPKYKGIEICGGKFQIHEEDKFEEHLCSECGAILAYNYENYCPCCGVKICEYKTD